MFLSHTSIEATLRIGHQTSESSEIVKVNSSWYGPNLIIGGSLLEYWRL